MSLVARPRSRRHQLPETRPGARALDLSVPLHAVQAHMHALTDEQTRPHDDVPHRALPLVVHGKVEHHTDARERAEHHRVEEPEAQGEGVFMN